VQNGPDPGTGIVQTQTRRGLDETRQPVQNLNELPQVAEPAEAVLEAVANIAGLGAEALAATRAHLARNIVINSSSVGFISIRAAWT